VGRVLDFYTRLLGFVLDVRYQPSAHLPGCNRRREGSACSIQFGLGLSDASPGSAQDTYLVVDGIETARRGLTDRGLRFSPIQHTSPIDKWQARADAHGYVHGPRHLMTSTASMIERALGLERHAEHDDHPEGGLGPVALVLRLEHLPHGADLQVEDGERAERVDRAFVTLSRCLRLKRRGL
jgi:hypothetical protein